MSSLFYKRQLDVYQVFTNCMKPECRKQNVDNYQELRSHQ